VTGGLVEEVDLGVFEDSSGDGDPLELSSTEDRELPVQDRFDL
jgi:hypothetical protein